MRSSIRASYDDALAGRAIPITNTHATGSNHQFSADAARVTAAPSLPYNPLSDGTAPPSPPPVPRQIASGTSALVGPGAAITATSLAVRAAQTMTVQSFPGGGSLGLVGIGVGLSVINITANVSAYVSPLVTSPGLNDVGDITISPTRTATVSVLGIAGSVGGFVALGSAVAFVNDTSNVQAALGVSITDSGLVQATQTSDATKVGGTGFVGVKVEAKHTEMMNLSTAGIFIGGIAGIFIGGIAGLGAASAWLTSPTEQHSVARLNSGHTPVTRVPAL